MPAHRLGTKKLKRKNLIHVHQILQVCTRCPNDFRHKFGKSSQNVTKGIAVKISLQFDEYFSNFLHSNFYWYIRDFHYNLLSKAQSYHKNIIFFFRYGYIVNGQCKPKHRWQRGVFFDSTAVRNLVIYFLRMYKKRKREENEL